MYRPRIDSTTARVDIYATTTPKTTTPRTEPSEYRSSATRTAGVDRRGRRDPTRPSPVHGSRTVTEYGPEPCCSGRNDCWNLHAFGRYPLRHHSTRHNSARTTKSEQRIDAERHGIEREFESRINWRVDIPFLSLRTLGRKQSTCSKNRTLEVATGVRFIRASITSYILTR